MAQPQPEPNDIMDVTSIVQQLEDLVKFSIECEEKELKPNISFIDIHKKLLQIQQDIQRFQDNYRAHLAQYGLKPEDVRPSPEEIAALDPKQRKIFDRMESLKKVCEGARDRLYQSMQEDPQTLKAVKEELKDKSKEKIRRKGKFKGMGGKEGWIPT
ncbi:MAG: hypothetical protein JSR37_07425 [Verrucomicrobia bacterium]|nr:hypothetical protein [Verrucomicrobiota bacterium]MBS0637541.1 hypothetical protein [Verrucomicrobiota bacterium]